MGLSFDDQNEDYTQAKFESIQALDIKTNLEVFTDTPIFCGMGTRDWFFDSAQSAQVIDAITQAGNDQAVFRAYRGVGHMLTREMVLDAIDFLEGADL